jgi:nucleoside-diphosphate-sugar epimerase
MSAELRTLVTGGAGYFGHCLVKKLRGRNYHVRIFDLNDLQERPPDIEFVHGDIRDAAAIRRASEGIDIVFHNVAQVPLAKDRNLFWSVNRDGTLRMLEAARDVGVRKVIYTSSSAVFGVPARNPVDESVDPRPMEDYGRAKYEGEKLCRQFSDRGLDISIIRPRTIMGYGRLGIFQILFEWIYQGSNIPVLDGGNNVYQFVHGDDLAEACILAGLSPGSNVFNCGAERFGTMREVLESLCHHARTGSKVVSLPRWAAELSMNVASVVGLSPLGPYHSMMYGRSFYFDISHAKAVLGWQPRYSNDEMFCQSYDWYCQNRKEVLRGSGHASYHRSAVKQGILSLVRRFL